MILWGGIVEFQAYGVPVGLGDPVYEKIEGNLAKAMMSLPASKGFEIGEGFRAARMLGSAHNDLFMASRDQLPSVEAGSPAQFLAIMQSNHAGGVLGGITTGMPLVGRVAFKPTASIGKSQESVDFSGSKARFNLTKRFAT